MTKKQLEKFKKNGVYFVIKGQCKSGKNSVVNTRTGHKFPKKSFVEWRENFIKQLEEQKIPKLKIDFPVSIDVTYRSGDLRRRDVAGMEDAICHVLERYGLVADDTHLGGPGNLFIFTNEGLDRNNPHIKVRIWTIQNGLN